VERPQRIERFQNEQVKSALQDFGFACGNHQSSCGCSTGTMARFM
jgi:hypothetical protein